MRRSVQKKTVVVTGANGLLGQKVVDVFSPHFNTLATSVQKESVRTLKDVEYHQLDLTNYSRTEGFLKYFEPDYVVNCAAYTNVDKAEEERKLCYKINATAVEHMTEFLRRTETKFVQVSTDYVFNGQSGPYRESDRPDPINYYGTTKLAAENAVRGSGADCLIFRTNVLYGAADSIKNNFVLWVMNSLADNQSIRVVDDQMNNATIANGLAEAILMGCVMNAQGLYHYGGTDFIDRYDFALKIADYFGYDQGLISRCSTADLNQAAPRPLKSGLHTDKVVDDLQIRLYDTKAGLKQFEKDLQKCEI